MRVCRRVSVRARQRPPAPSMSCAPPAYEASYYLISRARRDNGGLSSGTISVYFLK
jgi:hypothetical protein